MHNNTRTNTVIYGVDIIDTGEILSGINPNRVQWREVCTIFNKVNTCVLVSYMYFSCASSHTLNVHLSVYSMALYGI